MSPLERRAPREGHRSRLPGVEAGEACRRQHDGRAPGVGDTHADGAAPRGPIAAVADGDREGRRLFDLGHDRREDDVAGEDLEVGEHALDRQRAARDVVVLARLAGLAGGVGDDVEGPGAGTIDRRVVERDLGLLPGGERGHRGLGERGRRRRVPVVESGHRGGRGRAAGVAHAGRDADDLAFARRARRDDEPGDGNHEVGAQRLAEGPDDEGVWWGLDAQLPSASWACCSHVVRGSTSSLPAPERRRTSRASAEA